VPEPNSEATSGKFNPERKRYLEGCMSGLQIARAARAVSDTAVVARLRPKPLRRDAANLRAQNRFIKEGKKLSDPGMRAAAGDPASGRSRVQHLEDPNEWRDFHGAAGKD